MPCLVRTPERKVFWGRLQAREDVNGKYPTAPSVARSDDTTVLVSGTETGVIALNA